VTALPVAGKTQGFHLVDGQVGSEGRQVTLPQADAAEHGAETHGDEAGEREVGPALAPVGQAGEAFGQLGEFSGGLQTFGRMGGDQVAQGFGEIASAQDGAGARHQLADPELFGAVKRPMGSGHDTRQAERDPISLFPTAAHGERCLRTGGLAGDGCGRRGGVDPAPRSRSAHGARRARDRGTCRMS
jgi:hypothetical protein